MNLFELNDNYKTLASRDDLDPTILKDTLESIKDDRNTKLDNLASWADQLKSEIDFMTDKKKSWEEEITYRKNKLAWIKKYITNVLDDAGIKKIATENHLLSARNFKASTIIDSDKKLPDKFKITETTTKPDKQAIYQALKAGEEVPGAHLKANRNTVIK